MSSSRLRMKRKFAFQHDTDPKHTSKSTNEGLNLKNFDGFDLNLSINEVSCRQEMPFQCHEEFPKNGKILQVKMCHADRLLPKNNKWCNKFTCYTTRLIYAFVFFLHSLESFRIFFHINIEGRKSFDWEILSRFDYKNLPFKQVCRLFYTHC